MEKPVHTREVSGHRDPLIRGTDDAQRNQVERSTAEGETKAVRAVEGEAMSLANNGGIRLGVIWA